MKISVELINPFITSTINALEMMAQCKPTRTGISLKKDPVLIGDISGIMGITGDVQGAIVLSFGEKTACKIVGNMMGTSYEKINDEVQDGIQEIVNLVAGQSKAALAGTDYHFKLSIPTCISGNGHRVAQQKDIPCIVAEFDLEGENFTVEVSLKPNK